MKFYQRNWFIILLLIFFFPVGLFLMWKYANWNKILKIVVTAVFAICFVIYIASLSMSDAPSSSQKSIHATQEHELGEPSPVNQPDDGQADTDAKNAAGSVNQETQQPNNTATLGQINALKKAQEYLSLTSFSYSGLMEQLEFEGFSTEEFTYAADNCGADWNEQAANKAKEYLNLTSFSRSGLIEQLEFEGFSAEQAEYGATAVGY